MHLTALQEIAPSDVGMAGEEKVVIHVAVFNESARPNGFVGEELHSLPSHYVELVAKPMVQIMPSRTLCTSSIGSWLARNRLLGPVIVLCAILTTCLGVIDPGSQRLQISDPDSGKLLSVHKRHLIVASMAIALMLQALFFLGHQISLPLLVVCAQSFECLMIVGSRAICSIVLSWEYMIESHIAREVTSLDLALQLVHQSLLVPVHFLGLAMVDSWITSNRVRVGIVLAFTLAMSHSYYKHRYKKIWSDTEICFWTSCTNSQAVFLAAISHEIMFALKLLRSLCCGARYAVLTASLIDPRFQRTAHSIFAVMSEREFPTRAHDSSMSKHELTQNNNNMQSTRHAHNMDSSSISVEVLNHVKRSSIEHVIGEELVGVHDSYYSTETWQCTREGSVLQGKATTDVKSLRVWI